MYSSDDKLEKFAHTIYHKATREKQDILKRVEKQKEKALKAKELECLEQAYTGIQSGIRHIDKEKNEIVSRAIMDGKRQVLKHREEIVGQVFESVKKKIRAFTQTDEYKELLFSMIKTNLKTMGEGKVKIFIDNNDAAYLEELNSMFDGQVAIDESGEELLGGCIMMNETNKRYLNDTLIDRLNERRQQFMSETHLAATN